MDLSSRSLVLLGGALCVMVAGCGDHPGLSAMPTAGDATLHQASAHDLLAALETGSTTRTITEDGAAWDQLGDRLFAEGRPGSAAVAWTQAASLLGTATAGGQALAAKVQALGAGPADPVPDLRLAERLGIAVETARHDHGFIEAPLSSADLEERRRHLLTSTDPIEVLQGIARWGDALPTSEVASLWLQAACAARTPAWHDRGCARRCAVRAREIAQEAGATPVVLAAEREIQDMDQAPAGEPARQHHPTIVWFWLGRSLCASSYRTTSGASVAHLVAARATRSASLAAHPTTTRGGFGATGHHAEAVGG